MDNHRSRDENVTSSPRILENDTVSTSSNESYASEEDNDRAPVNLVKVTFLVKNVTSLLNKVQPFHSMLPEQFVRELSGLGKLAEECRAM